MFRANILFVGAVSQSASRLRRSNSSSQLTFVSPSSGIGFICVRFRGWVASPAGLM